MGYSHGRNWTEEQLIKEIKSLMKHMKISTMPTRSQMDTVSNSSALSNAISKRGGIAKYAKKLGLKMKPSDSNFGETYEIKCMKQLSDMGYKCEKMKQRYPYDLFVNDCVKMDVKVSNIFNTDISSYYTFNLEKKYPTCDVYICYCLDKNGEVNKTYIIPSNTLKGITQLSLGLIKSKYDCYIDEWGVINEYTKFNECNFKH